MPSRARRTVLKILTSFVWLLAAEAFGQCTPSNDTTRWGGNEDVVMQTRITMRHVHGSVLQDFRTGKPWSGVLVEIYDHAEIVLNNSSRNRTGQTRITGCVSDKQGRFSFKLKAGEYELRASNGPEWKVTSVIIRVGKMHVVSRRRLVVQLFPAS